MVQLDTHSKKLIRCELAKRDFYEYGKLRLPGIYKPDRLFLQDLCYRLQDFWWSTTDRFMVVNMPPRFCKSLTAQTFTEWVFGQSTENRVITGSYNERLATIFAKRVRNSIQTPPGQSKRIEFGDVFPGVSVSKGDAASDMWSLEGSPVTSYLATSPGGLATGVGANLIIVDDLIKNSMEAYSDTAKAAQADWFFNTMMSRLEGNWKVLIVMTRWATDDLAGRILTAYPDAIHVDYKAWEDTPEGRVFLCPEILDEESLNAKAKEMNPDILLANYQQEPTDIKGRLYHDFNEYDPAEVTVKPGEYVYAVTDTADKGTDRLASCVYVEREGIAYPMDFVFTDAPMEITEQLVSDMFDRWNVKVAFTESNNGGRLFARNVRRIMKNKTCVFIEKFQTANKQARIIDSSGWVQQYTWFPKGWKSRWPELAMDILTYNVKGKNEHDDGVDMLAYLYEVCTQQSAVTQTPYKNDDIPGETPYMYGQSLYDEEPARFW